MGRKLITCIFLLSIQQLISQTTIQGVVFGEKNTPLNAASVVLKDSLNKAILSYTYTNKVGQYQLNTNKKGSFYITFSSLGFEAQTKPIIISEENKDYSLNITLKEKLLELNEVIIQADLPIRVKKDTIVFDASSFTKGTEQVVEDLLKNIPGLNIDDQGTIKVGNQEIEKVMVDGDDFFKKGYKILTKNMPPNPIDKVEIYKNYSNNKLLKDIEESEKVALNLKLKENAKRVWFGNIGLGYGLGTTNRYTVNNNLMNFGKNNKYYFLTNFNNTGYDATGSISHLIKPFSFGEPASIGNNQSVNTLLNLGAYVPNFKASRTNFNNVELTSINGIFKLSKKVKLKTLGFFNWDENDFYRNSIQTFSGNDTNFTNTQDYTLRKKKFVGFGKVDLTYDISKAKMLEIITKYNNQRETNVSSLIFNSNETNERLKTNTKLFDQKITLSNKLQYNKALLISGRVISEKAPQNYRFDDFFFQDLFPEYDETNNTQQLSQNKMLFLGFETHLLNRKNNGNLFEFRIGNQFRKDNLYSSFFLKEGNSILDAPIDYQNHLVYKTNDVYFKTKYLIKLKELKLIGTLDVHQLFNSLLTTETNKQSPFFINPSIGLNWEINNKNKISSTYNYNTTNATVIDIYTNYALTGFRSFTKGTGGFNQLNASSLSLSYQLGNWSDEFFANTLIFYTKNHDFISTNSVISQNYSQINKMVINDQQMLSVSANIDKYFKSISSNFKISFGFSSSNYKNVINNSDLRKVKSKNYNYGFELRSGFKGFFNYHLGSKWTTNNIETTISNKFTDNVSFFDASFNFDNKVTVQLNTERYSFGSLDTDSTYYFADFESSYALKKNKINLSLTGKNLFNTSAFRSFSISDIGTSTTYFRLLPRYILLKLEYRF